MRAAVDDPVHVEVEVVEFGKERCVGYDLVDFWISFADPSVKLSNGIEWNRVVALALALALVCQYMKYMNRSIGDGWYIRSRIQDMKQDSNTLTVLHLNLEGLTVMPAMLLLVACHCKHRRQKPL